MPLATRTRRSLSGRRPPDETAARRPSALGRGSASDRFSGRARWSPLQRTPYVAQLRKAREVDDGADDEDHEDHEQRHPAVVEQRRSWLGEGAREDDVDEHPDAVDHRDDVDGVGPSLEIESSRSPALDAG